MKAAIAMVAVLLLLMSDLVSADPIITVHKDKANVFTEFTVPLIGGGTLVHSLTYEGHLLENSLSARPSLEMREDRPGGEPVTLSARAYASLDQGISGAFLELEAETQLNYPVYSNDESSIVFDDNREVLATAQTSVEWVFSASEETLIELYLLHKSGRGTTGARLYDKTAKKTIFTFDIDHWTDFEHFEPPRVFRRLFCVSQAAIA